MDTDSRGFRVPPYKMEMITALAHRITKYIAEDARFRLTAGDVLLALEIVRDVVKGGREDGGYEDALEEAPQQ